MKEKTFLIICTVRYCLGRQTYAIREICNLLKKEWDNIPMNDRKIILEDIRKYTRKKECTTLEKITWNGILHLGYKDKLIIERKENAKYT